MENECENFLVIDNFLSKNSFNKCMIDIEKNRDKFVVENLHKGHAVFNRWYPAVDTIIPKSMERTLYSKKMLGRVVNFADGCWKLFCDNLSSGFEVQVTSYFKKDKNEYNWHVDHTRAPHGVRVLNYILYLTDVDEGGELEISDFKGQFNPANEYKAVHSVKIKKKG